MMARMSADLRILLLDPNSHILPYDRALAGALVRAGCAVELVSSPFLYEAVPAAVGFTWRRSFFRLAAGGLGRRLGLTRRPAARRALKRLEYPAGLALLLARLARRPPAILHVQWSLWPALDRPLWRLLRRRGIAVVYTVHNLLPEGAAADEIERHRRLCAAADAVIVHTEVTAAHLAARYALPEERIAVAPHGPLLEEEPIIARAAARTRLGLPAGAPLVLFAGLIEPYKGLDDLVAAFIRLAPIQPDAHLVVAGRPNAPVAALREKLAFAGLGSRAHFDLRFLPQADLAAYLCAADVVALPYRATTSSGLLMAARRFACPVVATAVGDLAATVDDGRDGLLVAPGDPAALAAAIGRLLAEPGLAGQLGQAGQERAFGPQSWAQAAERTLAAYAAARQRRLVEG